MSFGSSKQQQQSLRQAWMAWNRNVPKKTAAKRMAIVLITKRGSIAIVPITAPVSSQALPT